MKSAKDWGWREFITLQALFDADAGYLLNDDCVFAAEVLMLKESSEAHQVQSQLCAPLLASHLACMATPLLNDGCVLSAEVIRPKVLMLEKKSEAHQVESWLHTLLELIKFLHRCGHEK